MEDGRAFSRITNKPRNVAGSPAQQSAGNTHQGSQQSELVPGLTSALHKARLSHKRPDITALQTSSASVSSRSDHLQLSPRLHEGRTITGSPRISGPMSPGAAFGTGHFYDGRTNMHVQSDPDQRTLDPETFGQRDLETSYYRRNKILHPWDLEDPSRPLPGLSSSGRRKSGPSGGGGGQPSTAAAAPMYGTAGTMLNDGREAVVRSSDDVDLPSSPHRAPSEDQGQVSLRPSGIPPSALARPLRVSKLALHGLGGTATSAPQLSLLPGEENGSLVSSPTAASKTNSNNSITAGYNYSVATIEVGMPNGADTASLYSPTHPYGVNLAPLPLPRRSYELEPVRHPALEVLGGSSTRHAVAAAAAPVSLPGKAARQAAIDSLVQQLQQEQAQDMLKYQQHEGQRGQGSGIGGGRSVSQSGAGDRDKEARASMGLAQEGPAGVLGATSEGTIGVAAAGQSRSGGPSRTTLIPQPSSLYGNANSPVGQRSGRLPPTRRASQLRRTTGNHSSTAVGIDGGASGNKLLLSGPLPTVTHNTPAASGTGTASDAEPYSDDPGSPPANSSPVSLSSAASPSAASPSASGPSPALAPDPLTLSTSSPGHVRISASTTAVVGATRSTGASGHENIAGGVGRGGGGGGLVPPAAAAVPPPPSPATALLEQERAGVTLSIEHFLAGSSAAPAKGFAPSAHRTDQTAVHQAFRALNPRARMPTREDLWEVQTTLYRQVAALAAAAAGSLGPGSPSLRHSRSGPSPAPTMSSPPPGGAVGPRTLTVTSTALKNPTARYLGQLMAAASSPGSMSMSFTSTSPSVMPTSASAATMAGGASPSGGGGGGGGTGRTVSGNGRTRGSDEGSREGTWDGSRNLGGPATNDDASGGVLALARTTTSIVGARSLAGQPASLTTSSTNGAGGVHRPGSPRSTFDGAGYSAKLGLPSAELSGGGVWGGGGGGVVVGPPSGTTPFSPEDVVFQPLLPRDADGFVVEGMITGQEAALSIALMGCVVQVGVSCVERAHLIAGLWATLRQLLGAVMADREAARSQVLAARAENASLQSRCSTEVDSMRRMVMAMGSQMERLTSRDKETAAELAAAKLEVVKLRQQLEDGECDQLRAELADLHEEYEMARRELERMRGIVQDLESEVADTRTDLALTTTRAINLEVQAQALAAEARARTPRPPRNLGILAELLPQPPRQQAILAALAAGAPPLELHRLLLGVSLDGEDLRPWAATLGSVRHVVPPWSDPVTHAAATAAPPDTYVGGAVAAAGGAGGTALTLAAAGNGGGGGGGGAGGAGGAAMAQIIAQSLRTQLRGVSFLRRNTSTIPGLTGPGAAGGVGVIFEGGPGGGGPDALTGPAAGGNGGTRPPSLDGRGGGSPLVSSSGSGPPSATAYGSFSGGGGSFIGRDGSMIANGYLGGGGGGGVAGSMASFIAGVGGAASNNSFIGGGFGATPASSFIVGVSGAAMGGGRPKQGQAMSQAQQQSYLRRVHSWLESLIRGGDVSPMRRLFPEVAVAAIASGLQLGLPASSLASWLLGGYSAAGFNYAPYKSLVGVLSGPHQPTTNDLGGPITLALEHAALSTVQRVETLEERGQALHREVVKLKRSIADQKRAERTRALAEAAERKGTSRRERSSHPVQAFIDAKWADFFFGLGYGNNVPKALRAEGRIFNRRMEKVEAEKLVNAIWAAKDEWAATNRQSNISLDDFLLTFLQRKFVAPRAVTETVYNLVHTLGQHSYDPDCNMFVRILLGEVDEGVRSEEKELQRDLVAMVSCVDVAAHSTTTGYISKRDMRSALKILEALDTDCPGESVRYRRLFDDDRDLNQGVFAETIRSQYLAERLEQLQALEDHLLDACEKKALVYVAPSLLAAALKSTIRGCTEETVRLHMRIVYGPETRVRTIEAAAPNANAAHARTVSTAAKAMAAAVAAANAGTRVTAAQLAAVNATNAEAAEAAAAEAAAANGTAVDAQGQSLGPPVPTAEEVITLIRRGWVPPIPSISAALDELQVAGKLKSQLRISLRRQADAGTGMSRLGSKGRSNWAAAMGSLTRTSLGSLTLSSSSSMRRNGVEEEEDEEVEEKEEKEKGGKEGGRRVSGAVTRSEEPAGGNVVHFNAHKRLRYLAAMDSVRHSWLQEEKARVTQLVQQHLAPSTTATLLPPSTDGTISRSGISNSSQQTTNSKSSSGTKGASSSSSSKGVAFSGCDDPAPASSLPNVAPSLINTRDGYDSDDPDLAMLEAAQKLLSDQMAATSGGSGNGGGRPSRVSFAGGGSEPRGLRQASVSGASSSAAGGAAAAAAAAAAAVEAAGERLQRLRALNVLMVAVAEDRPDAPVPILDADIRRNLYATPGGSCSESSTNAGCTDPGGVEDSDISRTAGRG